ncbi:hypothetical protein CDD80_5201 [Ophiocordyceps camponoti-rufipedis]|uniref:Uncharacterized protein n=1 Tax=Ophiocordyceps camponoti-rufipedis TaxID=2004952 RepID=A0A2C5ZHL6_9HYPO|nr:hypothetical protein CDD80_5201 [Ophiocordyceps camponoti-rufipedis]
MERQMRRGGGLSEKQRYRDNQECSALDQPKYPSLAQGQPRNQGSRARRPAAGYEVLRAQLRTSTGTDRDGLGSDSAIRDRRLRDEPCELRLELPQSRRPGLALRGTGLTAVVRTGYGYADDAMGETGVAQELARDEEAVILDDT